MCKRSLLMISLLISQTAAAAQLGDPDDLLSLEVHGFASQGFLVTTHGVNYLANTARGSFEFTEIGLNFTKPITDKLRFGLQLFSRDLGPIGNYTIRPDWFYLDYRFFDWLGVRAGRTKLPFGLYNDTSDIDSARVPVLLPQSIYPTQNRDFLLAQTGGELYGYLSFGDYGALDYRAYGGTIFLDIPPNSGISSFGVPYIVGGRLMYETPLDGLRFGGSVQFVRLEATLLSEQPPPTTTVNLGVPALLWVASVEYNAHDLLLAAEYSRWHTGVQSSDGSRFPPSTTVSERGYVSAAYRVTSWFHPGAYYSLYFPNVTQRTGRAYEQHDVALSLRFDIVANHWLVKAEAHYFAGNAQLTAQLNNNTPLTSLPNQWALFMLKTTAYF